MSCYYGIVIEQSLSDPALADSFEVIHRARESKDSWCFLIVRVQREIADATFARLQSALAKGRPWYAHFFCGEELVVVFSDAVLRMRRDPATWSEALSHGLGLGIPECQLDFQPHTLDGLRARFGIDPAVL